MDYDLIQLHSDDELRQGSRLLERLRGNITSRVTWALYVSRFTGDVDDSARALAEVLWVEEDPHLGVANLERLHPPSLLEKTTEKYLVRTLNQDWEKSSTESLKRLEGWIQYCMVFLSPTRSVKASMPESRVKPFMEMCVQKGFHDIAVYLAAVVLDWCMVRQVIYIWPIDYLEEKDEEYPTRLLLFLRNKAPWDVTEGMLYRYFDYSKRSCLTFSDRLFDVEELYLLAKRCHNRGLEKFGLFFYLHASKHWQLVENLLLSCSDKLAIGHVLQAACSLDLWQLVKNLLPKHYLSNQVILGVFLAAVEKGQVGVAASLLPIVDLKDLHRIVDNPVSYLMERAVSHYSRRTAERMTRLLIQAGLATHCESGTLELFEGAVVRKRSRLAKMLYQSGMVSHSDCREVLGSHHLENLMGRDPDLAETVRDVAEFTDSKRVRRLQEVARIRVSHLLGFHRRRDRGMEVLKVSVPVRNLLSFQDV